MIVVRCDVTMLEVLEVKTSCLGFQKGEADEFLSRLLPSLSVIQRLRAEDSHNFLCASLRNPTLISTLLKILHSSWKAAKWPPNCQNMQGCNELRGLDYPRKRSRYETHSFSAACMIDEVLQQTHICTNCDTKSCLTAWTSVCVTGQNRGRV